MTFPDKDQVREALVVFDSIQLVQSGQDGPILFPQEMEYLNAVERLARAFVDGSLLPAQPDYEAARFPILDTLAMMASKWLRISHEEAMQREDILEAATIVTAAVVDAALAGKQETGTDQTGNTE